MDLDNLGRNALAKDMIPPMSATEYAKALDRLGFSNVGFCHLLGINQRTGRNWKGERSTIPPTTAALLRLALHYKLNAEKFRKILDLK